ncbi:fungal-specific transcription factor domain-containing protein [Xylariales sp. PMI_506]|nr:fungal-specific transcription factor domain-containing protein [Xylariales sp. PMI_506]
MRSQAQPQMSPTSCWTCRDRRIKCDRTVGRCLKCKESNRRCRYGLRLSWPRENDTKRTLRLLSGSQFVVNQPGDVRLVNAGFWDIELHHYLSSSSGRHGHDSASHPKLPAPLSWAPFNIGSKDISLVDYFENVAFNSLSVFGSHRQKIRDILLRLAFSDDSSASNAVLKSTLAFSSLHRYGLHAEAAKLKLSAIQELESSSQNGIEAVKVIYHVATGMMLCYFEIQDIEKTSVQWLWYVCGSKYLMETINPTDELRTPEFSALGDWLDYHAIVGQFGIRHWHRMTMEDIYLQHEARVLCQVPRVCQKKRERGVSQCSHEILRLLYELFRTIVKPTDPSYRSAQYARSLHDLEARIQSVQPSIGSPSENDVGEDGKVQETHVELFKLASLIYLERASSSLSGSSDKISTYVERAFRLLGSMHSCDLPFPLFILGCEASDEVQRKLILDLIEQALAVAHSRGMAGVQRMLEAAWTQDDLVGADNELDYMFKLDTLITSNNIIPTFA